jgi:hypothetical protein
VVFWEKTDKWMTRKFEDDELCFAGTSSRNGISPVIAGDLEKNEPETVKQLLDEFEHLSD